LSALENNLNINSVINDLRLIDTTINTTDPLLKVYEIFEKEKGVPGIIVLKDDHFFGLLSRKRFFEIMSKQFMYDVFAKRTIDFFFNADFVDNYLILSSSTTIILASNLALQRRETDISEPIIVYDERNNYKLLDFYQLLLAQNAIQQLMNNLLQQANDFKQEVLAIAAHDLRNPIGVILGFSNLIEQDEAFLKSKEFAGHIKKTASQMEDMVNNFLVSAINNSIEFDLVLSWFDLYDLLNSTIHNFDYAIRRKCQTLSFDNESNDYMVYSDKIHLKEVFDNLISNAIKYSGEGKEINIRLSRTDNHCLFMIKDQGQGFSVKDMKNIYGKFQRLSARPTANESSTGLGLFIVKRIIDKLKGKIDLESKPGEGSIFTVTLPIETKDL
jgi:signal transduction histidine kinase